MSSPDASLVGLGATGAPEAARAVVDHVLSAAAGAAPRVIAIMVASADGRATVDGRSGPLGHPADRALFRELRGRADAVLGGSSTIAAEGYGNLIDDEPRARRLERGQPAHPLVATVARQSAIPWDADLFQEPAVPIVVFSERADAVPASVHAEVQLETLPDVTLELVRERLAARGAQLIVCEGGPTLLSGLVAAGLVDDLLLTVAPLLVGSGSETLLGSVALEAPAALTLSSVHRAGDHLFLHYRPNRADA